MLNRLKTALQKLGPGLITGAADDDPAGIATYSMAGGSFGYQTLWTALFSFPLMTAVQETCGRIGLVSRKGLAGVIKLHYPRPVLYLTSSLLFFANVFNIGADISGMAAAVNLLFPVNQLLVGFVVAVGLVALTIQLPYQKIVTIFKWLTIALFAYVLAFFLAKPNFGEIIIATFLPDLSKVLTPAFITMLVALFGTSISPYLFFWQTSEEAEEEKLEHTKVTLRKLQVEKQDTVVGMFISQLMMFFIIASTGATLFTAGISNIDSAAQAAAALRPLAGDLAFVLFAAGIIGTGALAVPVLAGSAAYAVAETFGFSEGLNKKFSRAKQFYVVIAVATLIGFLLNLIGLSPIKYLFYSAVLNGVVAPVMILMLFLIGNNEKIMGRFRNGWLTNFLILTSLLVMSAGAVAMLVIR